MVLVVSKFTACICQHAYLARFFTRHEELHAFDTRVSKLLTYATMLTSYATRFVRTNTHSPRDKLPVHTYLHVSRATK